MKPPRERIQAQAVTRARSQAAETYDRLSAVYDLLASSERRYIVRAEQLLAPVAGGSLLEIGCGTGKSLIELARMVGDRGTVTGADISPKMCERSRNRAERSGLGNRISVHTADAAALPLPDDSYDGVLCTFTLELFSDEDMTSVLSECRRVLVCGGRLAVVSLSLTGAGRAVQAYEWFHRRLPRLIDCRPIAAKQTIAASGYSILAVENYRMWKLPVDIVLATPSPCM